MRRIAARCPSLFLPCTLLAWSGAAAAQEIVHFPSHEDNGRRAPPTMLDGYLFRPDAAGPLPAIVGMHGCNGMFTRSGAIRPGLADWAARLSRDGYIVLLVDSLGPRQHGEMCSVGGFDLSLYRKRPRDAYGALAYLQAQQFVRGDRIGLIGWSQGGAATLYAIADRNRGRPAALSHDFRAAIAFYPGGCRADRHPAGWTTHIPLLALLGAADVWTPTPLCTAFLNTAIAQGSPITMQVYPGAYHAFDVPNLPRRELPAYRTRQGVVPIVGTDPAARADALQLVPAFLTRYLGD
ncbi:MAG: dienelactone hydrolase family protein [Thiohalocapsa sp.]